MDIQVELTGTDATEQNTHSLQDWIRKEQISGLRIERKSGSPKKDEMGLDPLTIFEIVLSSGVLVELVKSIYGWLQYRPKPNLKVRFKWGDKELEIEGDDLSDIQDLINKFKM